MVGIRNFGAYLPYLRYDRSNWVDVWGMKQMAAAMMGERTVANYDEDTITMGVEATLNCLDDINPKEIGGLYFGSTTAPYAEKQSSALIAAACDLTKEIRTADFAGSLRSGTTALLSATDAVKSGAANNLIVTVADLRISEPRFYMEAMMGDAAAALLVGTDDLICEIEGAVSISGEFTDVWRKKDEQFLHYDDERYSSTHGYLSFVPKVLKLLLEKQGLKPDNISNIVAYAPEGASYMALAKRSGFPMIWNQDPLLLSVGNTGSASPLLQLALVLEQAKPGDRIVMIGYGDGADAILLKVTDNIKKMNHKRGVTAFVNSKAMLNSYTKILQYRGVLKRNTDVVWTYEPFSSIAMLKHQERMVLPLYGKKCECGAISYPPRRVCPKCQQKDKSVDIKLKHTGKIFSYVADSVFPEPESPVVMAVVDLDGGGRLLTQLTDCDPDKVEVDMKVELTFRKFHEGKGYNNYFWKARPVRG